MQERRQYLTDLLVEMERRLGNAPDGRLHVNSSHGYSQYHHQVSPGQSQYLSKKTDGDLISALAEKDYYLRLRDAILAEIDAIDLWNAALPHPAAEQVYDTLQPALRQYVTPIDGYDQEFVDHWLARHQPWTYNTHPFTGNYTFRGIRFRSRAELILATLLEKQRYPWVYECPLQVTRDGYGEIIFPDFTVLNVRTRETYYLEYLGKMSDPQYMETNYRRLKLYEENGIYLGKQLIIIGESREEPLDVPHTEKILREYLT